METKATSTLKYDRTGSKTIKNIFLLSVGKLKINVTWIVTTTSSSKKITSYSKSVSGTGSDFGGVSGAKVTDHGIPSFYKGQRAFVKGQAYFGAILGKGEVWFYNDGGFDMI